jgi:hypothetical protein
MRQNTERPATASSRKRLLIESLQLKKARPKKLRVKPTLAVPISVTLVALGPYLTLLVGTIDAAPDLLFPALVSLPLIVWAVLQWMLTLRWRKEERQIWENFQKERSLIENEETEQL